MRCNSTAEKFGSHPLKAGFSLVEILMSLLVVSGAIATMFSGFDIASQLGFYARFETEAAMIAEREIEMLKAEIIARKIPHGPGNIGSRFPQKPGWKVNTLWSEKDDSGIFRLACTVEQFDRVYRLESFVFQPGEGR